MFYGQKIDKKGKLEFAEAYTVYSLFDYFKLADEFIDDLHNCSMGTQEIHMLAFAYLKDLHTKLEWILDTHPKS